MGHNGNDDLVPERCRLVLADGRPVAFVITRRAAVPDRRGAELARGAGSPRRCWCS